MNGFNYSKVFQWRRLGHIEDDLAGSLPVYCKDKEWGLILYTPGYVANVDNDHKDTFVKDIKSLGKDNGFKTAKELIQHAVNAKYAWEKHLAQPFAPTCLTLYLSNKCNLKCRYCFSNATPQESQYLDVGIALSGAKLVLENCVKLSLPFTVVFHGGGEPLFNRGIAERILDGIDQMAVSSGMPILHYVATNGVMSIQKAEWMVDRFEMIGISCDGPDFIQNYNRPLLNGKNTSKYIEQTTRIAREAGKRLHIRVTLTPDSFEYQPDIAEYICQILKPDEIHVEAVYY